MDVDDVSFVDFMAVADRKQLDYIIIGGMALF